MAKKVNKYDIRKNGPLSYRALQTENASEYTPDDSPFANLQAPRAYTPQIYNVYEGSEMSPLQAQGNGDYWGKSQYDNPSANANEWEDLAETRYENQPWYDTLANGVAKMYGNFATTFLSSIIGIPYGIEEAIRQQRWSALWDNDVTQALGDADDWMEEHFTNYRSQKQQDSPWYDPSNLFSMNFIADDIIKNNGFMMGSVASMAVGSGEIGLLSKALGYVGDIGKIGKTTQNVVSSLFAATGEGMIEAKQGVKERNKAERLNVDNALTPQYNSLQMEDAETDEEYARTKGLDVRYDSAGRPMDMAYERYMQKKRDIQARRQELDNRKAAAYQQIEESGQEMGNTILLANQGLLTMGNLLQFSKGMTKSFDLARHAAQTSSKIAKPAFATVSRASKNLADGYKIGGSKAAGRLWAGTKGFLTEGAEEMNQQFIQGASGAAFNEGEVNDYWKARLDPDAYRSTTESLYDFGTILDRGFRDSWGSIDQWEQFLVGGLTGAMGSYMPTKLFNQDKSKKLYDPRRYGEWQGGAIKEVGEFNRQYNQLEENVKDLNDILGQQDFSARVQRLAAHAYHEGNKTQAAENNDKKWWKDEDDKQTIHDIQSFLRAGRLGDLRAIYDQIGSEWSDEDIEGLKKATTREVTADEDKKKFDDAKDEEIAEISREQDVLQEQLDVMREDGSSDAAMGDISSRITALEAEKARLNQEKDAYKGQRRFIGAFIGEDGEATMTNDEIREVMKHNSEALNAKIDSYLDSVAAVNEATGGNLSKDQEDNLAYLHNMGKEGIKRFDDIMANNRKHLPKTFLLRTDKSPEQLAKEYAISDITFSKDDNTPEGYVKADTSLMDDKTFGNFFMREVMRGGSISPELGATPDGQYFRKKTKADKKLSAEEKGKRFAEQYFRNVEDMKDLFMDSYMKENAASEMDAENAFKNLMQELVDASNLLNSSGQYYKTLSEYMANPEKVEEAKAREAEKVEKKENEKVAKNKFAGKSSRDIKRDVDNGDTEYSQLASFSNAIKNGDMQVDDDTAAAIDNAKGVIDKQHSLEGGLGDITDGTVLVDAKQVLQWAANQAQTPEDLNVAILGNFDAAQLLSDDEIAYMRERGATDEQIAAQAEARKQRAIRAAIDSFNAYEADEDKRKIIPNEGETGNLGLSTEKETGHDSVEKSPSNQGRKTAPAKPKKPAGDPETTNIAASDKAREEAAEDSEYQGSNNGGTWRSTTRRYGREYVNGRWRNTKTPYHELPKAVHPERSKAIWEYLRDNSAFENVENASADRIHSDMPIRFKIRSFAQEIYNKSLSELTAEEKRESMVILMYNGDKLLGDLPLPYPGYEPKQDKKEVKTLTALYDEATDKLLRKYEKDGTTEAMLDGKEGLDMKFKDGSPKTGEIFEVLPGFPPYTDRDDTRPLNAIAGKTTGGKTAPFTLAIKVIDGELNIGSKKHTDASGVGKPGQPYILIPDASGRPAAVPFTTPVFDSEKMSDTKLYKMLIEALGQFEKYPDTSKNKGERSEAISAICSLLKIESPFVNLDSKEEVVFVYNPLGEKENRVRLSVPRGENWREALLKQLDGTGIQVALSRINGKISAGRYINENYNEVIGEIAYTNLPENTTHTVCSWFTIKNFTDKKESTRRVSYPEGTTVNQVLPSGRTVVVTTGNMWQAADPKTGETLEGDPEVDLLLARMQAENRGVTKGNIVVDINGETKKYNVEKNAFVNESTPKPQPVPQASNKDRAISYLIEYPKGDINDLYKAIGIDPNNPFGGVYALNDDLSQEGMKIDNNGNYQMPDEWVKKNKKAKNDSQLNAILGIGDNSRASYDEATTGIEDVATNADNFEDLSREEKVQYMEMAFKAQGDKKKDYQPHLDAFDAALGEDEANKHKPGYVSKAKSQFKSFWDLAEAEFKKDKGVVTTPQQSGQKAPEKKAEGRYKTLKEAEAAATALKILDRRKTQFAWNAIPEDLRIALMNGNDIQVTLNGESRTLSLNAVDKVIKTLKEWNEAAANNASSIEAKPLYRRVTEAQKKINIQKERRWLQKNLPMFNTEDRLHLLQGLLQIPGEKNWAWGRFQEGVITLSDIAARGTLYHEAFHAVTQTLLSNEELNALYDAAVKHYKETDVALVEELLAEDFRRYVQQEETPIIGPIRKFFRKIMNAIRNLSGYRDPVQELFYRINNGEFRESVPREGLKNNAFYSIVYDGRVEESLAHFNHPIVRAVVSDFYSRKGLLGIHKATGRKWSDFKEYWAQRGIEVKGEWRKYLTGVEGWVINDIWVNVGGNSYFGIEEFAKMEAERKKRAEEYAARQARKGVQEAQQWNRLTRSEKLALDESEMSKTIWDSLSTEEQRQWLDCHS